MSLVLPVLLAHAAHERPRLAAVFQADKLNGVHLVLWTEHLLMGLVCQRHTPVFGQGSGGVGELGALGTQVCGTNRAVHGSSVSLILITADYALKETWEKILRNYTIWYNNDIHNLIHWCHKKKQRCVLHIYIYSSYTVYKKGATAIR